MSTPSASPIAFNPPTSTALSVVLFLWLNERLCHIWCAVLLYNIMGLHVLDLGTLAPEGPWCMFYATRHQVYWGLTQCGFFLVVGRDITHTHTHTHTPTHTHTQRQRERETERDRERDRQTERQRDRVFSTLLLVPLVSQWAVLSEQAQGPNGDNVLC